KPVAKARSARVRLREHRSRSRSVVQLKCPFLKSRFYAILNPRSSIITVGATRGHLSQSTHLLQPVPMCPPRISESLPSSFSTLRGSASLSPNPARSYRGGHTESNRQECNRAEVVHKLPATQRRTKRRIESPCSPIECASPGLEPLPRSSR